MSTSSKNKIKFWMSTSIEKKIKHRMLTSKDEKKNHNIVYVDLHNGQQLKKSTGYQHLQNKTRYCMSISVGKRNFRQREKKQLLLTEKQSENFKKFGDAEEVFGVAERNPFSLVHCVYRILRQQRCKDYEYGSYKRRKEK